MTQNFDDALVEHMVLHSNGMMLHAVHAGPKDGPLLILLHGFPEFWYGWRHQIGCLAGLGWHVLVPDQRGYNLSAKPAGVDSYAVGQLAADVVGLIDALGYEQACLVGHDWGAVVAWETAIRYPQRLKKLAILNVPHPKVMSSFLRGSFRQMLKSWYIFFFQFPWLPEKMLSSRGYAGMRQMIRGGKPGTVNEQELDRYAAAWAQPGALRAMINWYRCAFRFSLGPRNSSQARVSVPTLMLWGMQDIALSSDMAKPSIELCDQGELIFFENATHWVQHDEAEGVNAALGRFLSQ